MIHRFASYASALVAVVALLGCGAASPSGSTSPSVSPPSIDVLGATVSVSDSDRYHGQERGIWLRKTDDGWQWAEFRVDTTFGDQRMMDVGGPDAPRTSCSPYERVSTEAATRLPSLFEAPITDHEARGGSGGTRLVLARDDRPLRVHLDCGAFDPSAATDATAEGPSRSLCHVAERIVALYRSRSCAPDECLPGRTECPEDQLGPELFGRHACLLPGSGGGAQSAEQSCTAP
jgi:hypothetical protein